MEAEILPMRRKPQHWSQS